MTAAVRISGLTAVSNDSARDTHYNGVLWHVSSHHASSANNGTGSNPDPFGDDSTSAKPDTITYHHPLRCHRLVSDQRSRFNAMLVIDDVAEWCNQAVTTYFHAFSREDEAVVAHRGPRANRDCRRWVGRADARAFLQHDPFAQSNVLRVPEYADVGLNKNVSSGARDPTEGPPTPKPVHKVVFCVAPNATGNGRLSRQRDPHHAERRGYLWRF